METIQLSTLKNYQQRIIKQLAGTYQEINELDVNSLTPASQMQCRSCGSTSHVKNGTYKTRQRYKCKCCGTTQFSDVNTPLYNLKLKEKWVDFVYIMFDNDQMLSCTAIGVQLEINKKTAHAWRHKLMSALDQIQALEIEQEVELDEVYFPLCVKGRIGKEKYDVWHGPGDPDNVESELRKKEKKMIEEKYQAIYLCAHNRQNDVEFSSIKVQKKGIVSAQDIAKSCTIDIKNKTVITDSEPTLRAFLRESQETEHQTFKSSDIKQGVIKKAGVHNNNINNLMMRTRKWLNQFCGVSTKYLTNYLSWFRFKEFFKNLEILAIANKTLTDKKAYERFLDTFDTYAKFIMPEANHNITE